MTAVFAFVGCNKIIGNQKDGGDSAIISESGNESINGDSTQTQSSEGGTGAQDSGGAAGSQGRDSNYTPWVK